MVRQAVIFLAVVLAAGIIPTDKELLGMTWFVKGAAGTTE